MEVIIFPAIDLRRGQVVRLRQGQADQMTVFGTDPLSTARAWVDQGAEWLHIVNLDGALGSPSSEADVTAGDLMSVNLQILRDVCAHLPATNVQFGGGIRSMQDLLRVFGCGASRAILGTAAVRDPELVGSAIERFGPERVVIGLDANQGAVVTHGWTQSSAISPVQLGLRMKKMGVRYAVYTDVLRDGMMSGVDDAGTAQLARATGLRVIASGGLSSLNDLRQLVSQRDPGIEGVIIGQALYTGAVPLETAIEIARGQG